MPAPTGGAVGIDMGVARFATLSDGSHLPPLNSAKKHQVALRKAQQAMSRRTKFSSNWKKAKARVQPHNTSRTCPECGHVAVENQPSQARFVCVECGFAGNADHVGAMNVLRAGHARLACEVSGAIRPPAAGTHRSDSGAASCRA